MSVQIISLICYSIILAYNVLQHPNGTTLIANASPAKVIKYMMMKTQMNTKKLEMKEYLILNMKFKK